MTCVACHVFGVYYSVFYRPTFITMDMKGGKTGDHNNSTQSKMISMTSADSCVLVIRLKYQGYW